MYLRKIFLCLFLGIILYVPMVSMKHEFFKNMFVSIFYPVYPLYSLII